MTQSIVYWNLADYINSNWEIQIFFFLILSYTGSIIFAIG